MLFDKKTKSIVSNESLDILKILNEDFVPIAKNGINLFPKENAAALQKLNDELVYPKVNNGESLFFLLLRRHAPPTRHRNVRVRPHAWSQLHSGVAASARPWTVLLHLSKSCTLSGVVSPGIRYSGN